jgi:hypothetical protein
MAQTVSWQEFYQAALLELDPDQLQRRIEEAQKAIRQRMAELRQNGPGPQEETNALESALQGLDVLVDKECKLDLLAQSRPRQE